MNTPDHQPLGYFQVSPVRGQLEPPGNLDQLSQFLFNELIQIPRQGQAGDIFNALTPQMSSKVTLWFLHPYLGHIRVQHIVLLPPRCAQTYGYLLSQERRELAKGTDASWEKLLHIRHLKDRMLRKCNRLSRLNTVRQTTDVAFRTIHAPPDFTLKELEKWYRHRHDSENTPSSFKKKATARPKSPVATRKAAVTAKHSHGTRGSSSQSRSYHRNTHGSTSRRSSNSNLSYATENTNDRVYADDLFGEDKTLPSVPEDESFVHVHLPGVPEAGPYTGATSEDLRASVISPDPLPIPYRSRSSVGEEEEVPVHFPVPEIGLTFPVPMVEARVEEVVNEPTTEQHTLHRRRSSLKRSNTRSSMKSVVWADVDQQKSRYAFSVLEIETAAEGLDQARTAHREELILLRDLHRSVTETKERLHLDEERMKVEREKLITAEEAVRRQEERLRTTFERLEIHEEHYQEKVAMALDEAHRNLMSTSTGRKDDTIYEENH